MAVVMVVVVMMMVVVVVVVMMMMVVVMMMMMMVVMMMISDGDNERKMKLISKLYFMFIFSCVYSSSFQLLSFAGGHCEGSTHERQHCHILFHVFVSVCMVVRMHL